MIERVVLQDRKKEKILLAICQLQLSLIQAQVPHGNPSTVQRDTIRTKVRRSLNDVVLYKPDVIIFPEISIPEEMLEELKEAAQKNHCIIIAGTHYRTANGRIVSVCPIIFPSGQVYFTEKGVISPLEKSVVHGESVQPGITRHYFYNSSIGNFCVLVCADFLDERTRAEVFDNEIDIAIVVACQNDSARYFDLMGHHCRNSQRGVYIAYSNLDLQPFGDGQSALFAVLHRQYRDALVAHHLTDLHPDEKVWAASRPNDFLICELNLEEKKPSLAPSVRDSPSVSVIAAGGMTLQVTTAGKRDYRLVAFDMDGTLLRGINFSWAVLWEYCGDANGAIWRSHLKRFRDKKLSYSQWCEVATSYFQSARLSKELIEMLVNEGVRATKNLESGIVRLKALGFRIALISGGIDIFFRTLVPSHRELFDDVFINKLHFDADGVVCGSDPTSYDFEGKFDALASLCDKYGLEIEQTIFVGDRFNDEAVLSRAGHSIVYSESDDSVAITSDHVIRADDLNLLVDYIEAITVRPEKI
ncbi:MAG TPA: HAD-IB family phosphatase [Rhizomicrobium sp.]|jgi:HAD superfamily phosphoserine phosphatase-like hydrolase|nr:HAD-IB family phosphatase [Rhizomicrobium sp.]